MSPPIQLAASGPTGSTLVGLEGSLTGTSFPADQLIGVDPADGRPLLARYDLTAAAERLTRDELTLRSGGGLWRWRELLPVQDWSSVIWLGEGSTPLVPARALARRFGTPNLFVKSESLNPTGSFKARGMAVAVSRALELGARSLVAPSAGNAGGALAAYARAAGLPATVVMPADAPRVNQLEATISGAELILVDGLISDCGRLSQLISSRTGSFDLSTLKEPYRAEGKKTMGFEIVEDLGWQLPDVIIYPTGGGTGLVGMWKAFAEFEELGLIGSERPRMFSVQSEGCAPIVEAFVSGEQFAKPWENASTIAAGLRVPSAVGDFLMLRCLRESGGGAVAIPDSEIVDTQREIGKISGWYTGLETAAAVAALAHFLEQSLIDRGETVVIFDTGAGAKSVPPSVDLPTPLANETSVWEEFVANRGEGPRDGEPQR
jgi:threonine synthase